MTSLTWSQGPQTRSRANKEVEKRNSQLPDKNLFDSTPLKFLYVDGMDEEQIWEQLDLRTNTICRVLDFVLEGELKEGASEDGESEEGESEEEESDDENEANPNLGLRQAIERLRHDLFADEEEEVQEGESEEENDDELEPNPKLGSRQAIERLKHDLFAEEEEELLEGESEEEEEENDDEHETNPELGRRRAIERLKHDLFAEEEEEVQDGKCLLIHFSFLNTNPMLRRSDNAREADGHITRSN